MDKVLDQGMVFGLDRVGKTITAQIIMLFKVGPALDQISSQVTMTQFTGVEQWGHTKDIGDVDNGADFLLNFFVGEF